MVMPPAGKFFAPSSVSQQKCITLARIAELDAEKREFDSTDNLDYRGSGCGISWEPLARVCAKVRGRVRMKVLGNAVRAESALLVVPKFFVPGHLNRFELSFVR